MDLEQGRLRSSAAGVVVVSSDDEEDRSRCFSDAEEGGSCYSQFYSTAGGSYDEHSFSRVMDVEIMGRSSSGRASSVGSNCSVDVEMHEVKIQLSELEREKDCRICHLELESNSMESGPPIELGCSCKEDLGAAHRNCAETWFKIKGDKICEICHSIASNVVGINEVETTGQPNEPEAAAVMHAISPPADQ
ncbi:hypothetical protein SAY86_020912 [Trapa natans]|uniref:RING-CH-type domain-containing protein n=1 Tax=Trapa natans TaxID=22666 RepID=A0AAN7MRJ2_TRANT|nr:hypothetical protein SAY86_020912 [Trapa natans]